jgi:chromosome segregation ATPase
MDKTFITNIIDYAAANQSLKSKREQIAKLINDINAKSNENNGLNEKIKELELIINKHNEKIIAIEGNIKGLENDNHEISQQQQKIELLKAQLNKVTTEKGETNAKIDELKTSKEDKEVEINSFVDNLKAANALLENYIDDFKEEIQNSKKFSEDEKARTKKEIEQLQNKNRILNSTFENLETSTENIEIINKQLVELNAQERDLKAQSSKCELEMTTLNEIIAVAIRDCVANFLPHENVQIKWPNDILVNHKKIAGVLVENNIANGNIVSSVIGIGLNVNQVKFDSTILANSFKLITQQVQNI